MIRDPQSHCKQLALTAFSFKCRCRIIILQSYKRVSLMWQICFPNNSNISDLYLSLPSSAAAPPGIIFVINIPGSSPIWGLSGPPDKHKHLLFPQTSVLLGPQVGGWALGGCLAQKAPIMNSGSSCIPLSM